MAIYLVKHEWRCALPKRDECQLSGWPKYTWMFWTLDILPQSIAARVSALLSELRDRKAAQLSKFLGEPTA